MIHGQTPGHVLISRVGERVKAHPSDPDLLDPTTVQRLDSAATSWSPALGQASARAGFWAEALPLGPTPWSLPEVQLSWVCGGSSGLPGPVVQSVAPGWVLPLHAVDSGFAGGQEVILRPDQSAGELSVVLRGRPDARVDGTLVATVDPDVWTFSLSWATDTLLGSLQWVPTPAGHTTLTMTIDSGELQGLDLSGRVVSEIQPW